MALEGPGLGVIKKEGMPGRYSGGVQEMYPYN